MKQRPEKSAGQGQAVGGKVADEIVPIQPMAIRSNRMPKPVERRGSGTTQKDEGEGRKGAAARQQEQGGKGDTDVDEATERASEPAGERPSGRPTDGQGGDGGEKTTPATHAA